MLKAPDYQRYIILRIVEALNQIRAEYASAMEASDAVATGKTLESMNIVQEDTGASLYGRSYFFSIETGRSPNKKGHRKSSPRGSGSGSTPTGLGKAILEWVEAKNLHPKYGKLGTRSGGVANKQRSLAFAITRQIGRKGTRLYFVGARRDIISTANIQPYIDSLRHHIFNDVGMLLYRSISTGVKKNVIIQTTNITF